MDKKAMEDFANRLIVRTVFQFTSALFIIIIYFCLYAYRGDNLGDFERGFNGGCIPAACAVLVARGIMNIRAVRKQKFLGKKYVAENDEREIFITRKSFAAALAITIISLYIATVTASFFNRTVFLTLLSVLIFIVAVQLTVYLFYRFVSKEGFQ